MSGGAGVRSVLAALGGCERVLALDRNPAAVDNTVRNGIYWNPPFLDAAAAAEEILWHPARGTW